MAVQKTIEVLNRSLGTIKDLPVDDRTTSSMEASMNPGEPVKRSTNTDQFILPVATGDPEQGTDIFLGVTKSVSTETSSTEGYVDVEFVGPGTLIQGFATTASNINTVAKLDDVKLDFVNFDVSALTGTNGDFTIDEDEDDDSNVHALQIVGGDIVKGKIDALVSISAWYNAGV